jgi:hypothetical protein
VCVTEHNDKTQDLQLGGNISEDGATRAAQGLHRGVNDSDFTVDRHFVSL